MQIVQTPGAPPNQGRMYLPINGCTWKSRNAPVKIVSAYANMDWILPMLIFNSQRLCHHKTRLEQSRLASQRQGRQKQIRSQQFHFFTQI